MILIDTLKLFKDKHYRGLCIIEFVDILAQELTDQAKAQQAFTLPVTNTTSTKNKEIESQLLQLSTPVSTLKNSIHR